MFSLIYSSLLQPLTPLLACWLLPGASQSCFSRVSSSRCLLQVIIMTEAPSPSAVRKAIGVDDRDNPTTNDFRTDLELKLL